jgi:hypothetical protein
MSNGAASPAPDRVRSTGKAVLPADTTLAHATILRADVAIAMGDDALGARLLGDVDRMDLTVAERASLADDLARLHDLREAD